ncbi:AAA family ATPase [archaeon]|jgi:septum site-determining protein MinD|nr:AAA family ATPase [archaeon]MBT4396827.1 AAA family ATPase [archaeon]MBT4441495.1 AAA family ATPase [archaeon]
MGKVIGIISVKGGVGKTSCTSNIGASLAKDYNQKVLVVDANFSAPNLGLHLGVADVDKTIHEVLKGKCSILESIYEYDDQFHLIPARLNYRRRVDYKKFKSKLGRLKKKYDYILIDSSPSLNSEIKATIEASDYLLVVTSGDYPTVATTVGTVNEVVSYKKPILGLVVNKYKRKKFELSREDIEGTVGIPVISFLQENRRMGKSLAQTTPFVLLFPRARLSKQFRKLASLLIE